MEAWLPTRMDNVGVPPQNVIEPKLWLPPRELWLIDTIKEKIPTPVDSRGIVDIPKTIEAVKQIIDPSYIWPRVYKGPHHFHWREDRYSREPDPVWRIVPAAFRDLPPLKGDIGRALENVLHIVTEEPEVPDAEVMSYYAEGWRVAKGLFECAKREQIIERRAKRRAARINSELHMLPEHFEGEDREAKRYFGDQRSRILRGRDFYLMSLERVPPEFRIVQPETSPRKVAEKVGRLALVGSHKLTRTTTQAA